MLAITLAKPFLLKLSYFFLLLRVLLLTQTNHYSTISIYIQIPCSSSFAVYFTYVYANMYKCIYKYMYVYIWEYANPCKLTFAWWVFSLGFRFVYMQEVEKYFCSEKWRVVIHVSEKCRKIYCTVEKSVLWQKEKFLLR